MEFGATPRLSPVGIVLEGADEAIAARSGTGSALEAATDVSFDGFGVHCGFGVAATEVSSLVNFTVPLYFHSCKVENFHFRSMNQATHLVAQPTKAGPSGMFCCSALSQLRVVVQIQ